MDDLRVNFRLWIYADDREGVFGDGKLRLLQAIDVHGSLQNAARNLGISYRKAWGDLKKAEACLNAPLIERTRGGHGGGHMTLTERGREVLHLYLSFRETIHQTIQTEFNNLKEKL